MAGKKKITIVVSKGNPDVMANGLKVRAIQVLAEFLDAEGVMRSMDQDDKHIMMVFDRDQKGDPKWVRENITNKVDILGADDTASIHIKAEKLKARFDDTGREKCLLGYAVIESYLREFYLLEKNASIFGGEDGQ